MRRTINSLGSVSAEDVRQVLDRLGFSDRSQKGSHHNMLSSKFQRAVTVPDHGSPRKLMSPVTLNNISNQLLEILGEEMAALPKQEQNFSLNKELVRSWMSDPRGNRQEIQDFASRLHGEKSRRTPRGKMFTI